MNGGNRIDGDEGEASEHVAMIGRGGTVIHFT
jgi:hypothetical protein